MGHEGALIKQDEGDISQNEGMENIKTAVSPTLNVGFRIGKNMPILVINIELQSKAESRSKQCRFESKSHHTLIGDLGKFT